MTEALEDQVVTDEATVHRYHATIGREARRMAHMVDDLFELSRCRTSAIESSKQMICLADLVSTLITATAPLADTQGVTLRLDLSETVRIFASASDVERVVRNLLDNAIRHTCRGGTIVIAVTTKDDHALVTIHDECGGIPVECLDQVFDLAFQADQGMSGSRSGGFGLAIARGLVQAHEGDIAVVNRDEGCEFTVRLPLEG